jgi:hypothetical protein
VSHYQSLASPNNAASILAPLLNADTVALAICTPVYVPAVGECARAQGSNGCVGVVIDLSIPVGSTGNVMFDGVVTAPTTAQWDAVCGTSGGLAVNQKYYLSTSLPGTLTTSSASGVAVIEGVSAMIGNIILGQGSGGGGGSVGPGTVNAVPKFATTTTVGNSAISDNGTAITATEPVQVSPASGSASVAPLTVRADTTNLKAVAMSDASATNFAGFRWADSTHVAFRDMSNGSDLLQWAIGQTGTSAVGLLTALSGITSTAGANTLGKTVANVTTDTTSNGVVANYALPANTQILIFDNATSDIQFTGMTPGVAGQWMIVLNLSSGAHNFTVYDSNTNSSSANRLRVAGTGSPGAGSSCNMAAGSAAFTYFDGSNWWWFILWNVSTPSALSVSGTLGATGQIASGGALILSNAQKISSGVGTPNGSVVGSPGDLYLNTSGGSGTTLYVKESGSATNTGWVGK